ncbi:MAG: MmcQ/YjbR family DNA-binding protein [Clostridia bacterium]|nr:MmcQ/YjbR family DNA-binding protein [Clostridia bacterium]
MIDIPSIVGTKKPDPEKLAARGFVSACGLFSKDFPVMDGQYISRITISKDGAVDIRVYEADTGEEYMPAHIYGATGAYVGAVHSECEAILRKTVDDCFFTDCFRSGQSKRILRYIRDVYDAGPEFLWRIYPEIAAIRVHGKKSWFAIVGRIPKDRLFPGADGVVEIINLKGSPDEVKTLTESKVACPAYHMNKRDWYSLVLDDTLPDERVTALIDRSVCLVEND